MELTQRRILDLAWEAALANWANEHERLRTNPESELAKTREHRTWEELNAICRLVWEANNAE